MKRSLPLAILLSLVVSGAFVAGGCKKEPEAPAVVPPNERVPNIELPLSRRSGDPVSTGAPLVLIAFDAINVGGRDVTPLNRGALTPVQDELAAIPAVQAAVPSGTTEVRIRMHASAKYGTLLAVLASLRAAGVTRIGFDVKKNSLGDETGTLVVASLEPRVATRESPTFQEPYARSWDTISEIWDDAFVACEGSAGSFDCSPVTDKLALGGDVEIGIFRRQGALILYFQRFGFGNDIPAAENFMNQQNTRTAGVRNRDRDREERPPATSASFGFRWESLNADPESPLAVVMRAATANGPVGVHIAADRNSEGGAILSVIGAAFPDGVTAPAIVLDTQSR